MNKPEYYIGIDAGTSSVGWAVTTPDYQLVKQHGKALWGARLFDEASTAEKRRMARTARRRRDRQSFRMSLLRELFSAEITKVDPAFYLRLEESKFFPKEKKVNTRYCLFADKNFNDRDYHRAYPTVYHLRRELMENPAPHDVRLVYLAIAHMLKHRGHFLSGMSATDSVPDFLPSWENFCRDMEELMGGEVLCEDVSALQNLLQEKCLITEKKKRLKQLITVAVPEGQAPFTCIYDLLAGANCDVSKSFGVILDSENKNDLKLSFVGEDMDDEEKCARYHGYLENRFQILLDLKDIYNWGQLVAILHGADTLSAAKVESYEKHKADKLDLQALIRKEKPEKYSELFRTVRKGLNNYCAYSGHYDTRNEAYRKAAFRCTQEDFYKYLKGLLKDINTPAAEEILREVDLGTFLPLQHTKENSVIPYQMHLRELKKILDNASRYLPFLLEQDEQGITVREKVESLLTFRVPYYVGPLDNTNAKTGAHWAVKRHPEERVLPWNFDRVVDKEASAQAFMEQLTNTCTYLIGEPVLPKDSVSYGRFMVLNALNNLSLHGERISVELKQQLFNDLFLQKQQVSYKDITRYLVKEGLLKKEEIASAVSGIDIDYKAGLGVELRLRKIFGEALPSVDVMDAMIRAVLILKQEPDMLRNRLRNILPTITDGQLNSVCRLPCSGWGRLSQKFLTGLTAELEGKSMTILDALWNTQYNLMQLLSGSLPYGALVEAHNDTQLGEVKLNFSAMDDVDAPPYVRRTVWQTLRIVKEIIRIMGGEPAKIFVEMARGTDGSGRTRSRKYQLQECYKQIGEEGALWASQLEAYDDARLRQDKLYLYFTQMGRCMYSGKSIDLSDLLGDTGNQIFDIDHIYPRSKVKDDSLDNRVLVYKQQNQNKTDVYPLDATIRSSQSGFWTLLYHHGLISKRKLDRLTRATPFTEDELAGFVSRQLVETRQSTKLLAGVLSRALPESRVVYVKAGNVSDFRQQFGITKVRDLNDYHHAKDAYLNIVVGNVYDVKFTTNPLQFIRSGERYSMKPEVLFKHPVQRGKTLAWAGEESAELVKKTCRKNNVMITRQCERRNSGQNGGLYDQNPVRDGVIPLKGDERLADVQKYGGYSGDTGTYMFLVEHGKGKKRVRSIEAMYLRYAAQVQDNSAALEAYCRDVLGLTEPRVLVPEIKYNALLELRGFPIFLSGRSGNNLVGKQAFQLVLPEEQEIYLKKVLKICDRMKQAKGDIVLSEKYDGITAEQNLQLYDAFLEKMQIPVYANRPASQMTTVEKGRDAFEELSLQNQCRVLNSVLALFRGNGQADLTLIGGSSAAGKLQISRALDAKKGSAKLIDTSVTGFYRYETDLFSL